MRKLATVVLGIALFLSSIPAASSSSRADLTQEWQGISVFENWEINTSIPRIMASGPNGPASPEYYFCQSLDDEPCKAAPYIEAFATLPPCSASILTDCLNTVSAIGADGKKVSGAFQRFVPESGEHDFAAQPELNLPQGRGQGAIWRFPGLSGQFYVGVFTTSGLEKSSGSKIYREKFSPFNFNAMVSPVVAVPGKYLPSYSIDSSFNPSIPGGGAGSNNKSIDDRTDCFLLETGFCYKIAEFPEGYRFGLTVKLSGALQGWFHGRVSTPEVSVVTTTTGQEISIEASPVIVPTLKGKVATSEISRELRTLLLSNKLFGNGDGYLMPGSYGDEAFEVTKPWLSILGDMASTSRQYWSVKTLVGGSFDKLRTCTDKNKDVTGIVSTNSLVYSAGPPAFDTNDQTLTYKLLSPHFQADSQVAKGTYDLRIRSSVARCIYGFSSAPIRGSVSIVSEDGVQSVATETLVEKAGWLYLSANNFTFSSPTVRIKLEQEAPAPVVKPAAKTSISCVKGKTTKKITGTNPKCPSGYKKKG